VSPLHHVPSQTGCSVSGLPQSLQTKAAAVLLLRHGVFRPSSVRFNMRQHPVAWDSSSVVKWTVNDNSVEFVIVHVFGTSCTCATFAAEREPAAAGEVQSSTTQYSSSLSTWEFDVWGRRWTITQCSIHLFRVPWHLFVSSLSFLPLSFYPL